MFLQGKLMGFVEGMREIGIWISHHDMDMTSSTEQVLRGGFFHNRR